MAKEFRPVAVKPTLKGVDFTAFPEIRSPTSRISFGGKHFEIFVHGLSRSDFVEYFAEESPMSRVPRTSWRFRPEIMSPDTFRGRGVGFRPIIDLHFEEATYKILIGLLPRELMFDMRYKGAAYLYMYLGFCCLDGDMFGAYYKLFGLEDYRTQEDNFLVLNNLIVTMIESRAMENCFWALQKEAQKTFLELFI